MLVTSEAPLHSEATTWSIGYSSFGGAPDLLENVKESDQAKHVECAPDICAA